MFGVSYENTCDRNPFYMSNEDFPLLGLFYVRFTSQFAGYTHGDRYTDLLKIGYNDTSIKLTKINLRSGKRVDGVEFILNDGTSLKHGGNGGGLRYMNLASDEYITKIEAHKGKKSGRTRVFYLSFETNKKQILKGGRTTNDKVIFYPESGFEFVGMYGTSGNELDSVGFIMKRNHTMSFETGVVTYDEYEWF
eukprot:119861_1